MPAKVGYGRNKIDLKVKNPSMADAAAPPARKRPPTPSLGLPTAPSPGRRTAPPKLTGKANALIRGRGKKVGLKRITAADAGPRTLMKAKNKRTSTGKVKASSAGPTRRRARRRVGY